MDTQPQENALYLNEENITVWLSPASRYRELDFSVLCTGCFTGLIPAWRRYEDLLVPRGASPDGLRWCLTSNGRGHYAVPLSRLVLSMAAHSLGCGQAAVTARNVGL